MTLQNNLTDDLVVGSGPFTFPTPLPSGAAYAVSIKSLPTGMGQMCAVSGGNGTVANAPVNNVLVRCSFTLNGAGGAIVDGVQNSCSFPDAGIPLVSTIIVDAGYFALGRMTVALNGLNHSYVGDLSVWLQHVPTGTAVSLFDRLGVCSDDSTVNGIYRFSDGYSTTFCSAAAAQSDGGRVPPGNYRACRYVSSPVYLDSLPPGGFSGESVQGAWRLFILDVWTGDVGSLSSWSLTFSPP